MRSFNLVLSADDEAHFSPESLYFILILEGEGKKQLPLLDFDLFIRWEPRCAAAVVVFESKDFMIVWVRGIIQNLRCW